MFSHHLQCHQPTSVITCIAFTTFVSSPIFNATCSSPHCHLQVPTPLHVKYFCYHRLSIRSSSLAVAANMCHSQSYPSLSAHWAQLCASWAPTQDHALEELDVTSYMTFYLFSYVSSSLFCLSSCAPFQPVFFCSFHWTLSYIAVFSMSRPPSHSKTYTFIDLNFEHQTYSCMMSHRLSPTWLELHLLQSLFPLYSPSRMKYNLSLLIRNCINTITQPCWTAGNCGPLPFSFSCMPFQQLFVQLWHFAPLFFNFATCFSYVSILTCTTLTFKDPCVRYYLGASPAAVRD